jgi:hypothetical protein
MPYKARFVPGLHQPASWFWFAGTRRRILACTVTLLAFATGSAIADNAVEPDRRLRTRAELGAVL